jgi:hypothetical protein
MKGWQVALIVGGLVAVGGGVYVFTRPGQPARAAARPSQSAAGSLISQIGGRALSQGLNFLEGKLEDNLGSFFG